MLVSKRVPYWEGNEERPQTGGWHFYKQENSLTRPVFLSWGAAKRRRCLPRPHPRHQNLTIYTEASMGSVTGTTRWSQPHPVLKARSWKRSHWGGRGTIRGGRGGRASAAQPWSCPPDDLASKESANCSSRAAFYQLPVSRAKRDFYSFKWLKKIKRRIFLETWKFHVQTLTVSVHE